MPEAEIYIDVEKAKRAILEKIGETEYSVALIAQEMSRRAGQNKVPGDNKDSTV